MIPKKIYYCWFGGPKFWIVQKCIDSWRRVLPEYEITEINESNIDVEHPFIQRCLKMKKWAFLSDMARFLWLKDNPGIYLDTDIYLLKPFSDGMLSQRAFIGIENSKTLAHGIIGVSDTDSPLIMNHLNYYLSNPEKMQYTGYVLMDCLKEQYGDIFNFKYSKNNRHTPIIIPEVGDLAVYSKYDFYPVIMLTIPDNGGSEITALHLYTCSATPKNNIASEMYYNSAEARLEAFFSSHYPEEWNRDLKFIFKGMSKGKSVTQLPTMPKDLITTEDSHD